MERRKRESAESSRGRLTVLAALVVLTLAEYVVGVKVAPNLSLLLLFMLAQAALIIWYSMELPKLWRRDEEEEI